MQDYIGTGPEFIAAWRHVVNIFDAEGATNVQWVWDSQAAAFCNGRAQSYYPGDAYVDWIAGTAIPPSESTKSFTDLFNCFYAWGATKPQPLMVQTGVVEVEERAQLEGELDGRHALLPQGHAQDQGADLLESSEKATTNDWADTSGRLDGTATRPWPATRTSTRTAARAASPVRKILIGKGTAHAVPFLDPTAFVRPSCRSIENPVHTIPAVTKGGDRVDAKRPGRRYPLFAGLSKKEREQIARWADEIDEPAGYTLVDQGRFAHEFFVLLEGTVDVRKDDQHLTDLGPGDFSGEIALVEDERRTASVTATRHRPRDRDALSRLPNHAQSDACGIFPDRSRDPGTQRALAVALCAIGREDARGEALITLPTHESLITEGLGEGGSHDRSRSDRPLLHRRFRRTIATMFYLMLRKA